MDIMFVASEATPYAKTGGLADVLGSLPGALRRLGHRVGLVMPMHAAVRKTLSTPLETFGDNVVLIGGRREVFDIHKTNRGEVDVYLIDHPDYFGSRERLYGYPDDGERYAFFNLAVLEMFERLQTTPDIVHLNDWHSALIPLLIRERAGDAGKRRVAKTVLTIHNLAYQGNFSADLRKRVGLPDSPVLARNGDINFLKAGIETADVITTVSRSYTDEILEEPLGCGLSGVLDTRRDRLYGIMNGLDYETFDPRHDRDIEVPYDLEDVHVKKPENKDRLRKMFHMEEEDLPLFGMVTRIDEAKGFPILEDVLEEHLAKKRLQFVLLGSGDERIESRFSGLRKKYPTSLGVYFGYSDPIARAVYAGSDFFMMPSRFEPCGLAQLIAMRYGTPPLVHATGGLKDSVVDVARPEGTGFVFDSYSADSLNMAVERAMETYRERTTMEDLIVRAMKTRFDWRKSAEAYEALYKKLMEV